MIWRLRMLEHGRREHHLLSGIGVQILMVALLVFAYTQAIRQLKHSGEMRDRLEEQLTVARDQLARHSRRPDVESLQREVAELKSTLLSKQGLEELAHQLRDLVEKEYRVRDLEVKAGDRPTQALSIPLDGRMDFEAQLYVLELSGATTSRTAAVLAAALGRPSSKLLAPLVAMEMKRSGPKEEEPVRLSLRWLLAVSPGSTEAALPGSPAVPAKQEWGWREEPFYSPFERRSALKIPAEKLSRFHLTGIVWDEAAPACVINGMALKPGDAVAGYQVVLITPQAVLLEEEGEELLLRLP